MQSSLNLKIIDRYIRDTNVSSKNSDPTYWTWDKEGWSPASPVWQDFYVKWYGDPDDQSDSLDDPKSPSLSLEPLNECLKYQIPSSMFIRRSYLTMFNIIWAQSVQTVATGGVILTGQSGIGKKLFNIYLLVRLLMLGQVILFSPDGQTLFLFDHDGVYTSTLLMHALNATRTILPKPVTGSSNVFIWSLFDISEEKEPDGLLWGNLCFPVQISSPDPIRYHRWQKHRTALVTGLPSWTHDELAQGLKYQAEYQCLSNALEKVYTTKTWDALHDYPAIRTLLQDHYSGNNALPPSPENALAYLLDGAIERFGYSAGEVFRAVCDYDYMVQSHKDAFNFIDYEKLQSGLSLMSINPIAAYNILSDRVLALSPVYHSSYPLVNVRWKAEFKSEWVGRSVIQRLDDLREFFAG